MSVVKADGQTWEACKECEAEEHHDQPFTDELRSELLATRRILLPVVKDRRGNVTTRTASSQLSDMIPLFWGTNCLTCLHTHRDVVFQIKGRLVNLRVIASSHSVVIDVSDYHDECRNEKEERHKGQYDT